MILGGSIYSHRVYVDSTAEIFCEKKEKVGLSKYEYVSTYLKKQKRLCVCLCVSIDWRPTINYT